MSRMSISMCENDGVPSVITMCRAARGVGDALGQRQAAGPSRTRVEQLLARRSPANGIAPSRTAPRRAGSLSTPITRRPRSAKRERQRQPHAAEADHGDVGGALRGGHRAQRLVRASADRSRRRLPGHIRSSCDAASGARARTDARSPPRSGGCSGRSAATAGAARARGGRSTPGRCAASTRGAWGTSPAWKSNAAPTPTSSGADRRGRMCCIHRSCLGWPVPTHTTCSAASRRSRATTRRSSSAVELAEGRGVAAGDPQAREALAQAPVPAAPGPRACGPRRGRSGVPVRAARAQKRAIRSGP